MKAKKYLGCAECEVHNGSLLLYPTTQKWVVARCSSCDRTTELTVFAVKTDFLKRCKQSANIGISQHGVGSHGRQFIFKTVVQLNGCSFVVTKFQWICVVD